MNRSDALITVLAVFLLAGFGTAGFGMYMIAGAMLIAGMLAVTVPVTLRYGYAAGMAVLGSILAALAGAAGVLCALA